jgi:hypothetical protein
MAKNMTMQAMQKRNAIFDDELKKECTDKRINCRIIKIVGL